MPWMNCTFNHQSPSPMTLQKFLYSSLLSLKGTQIDGEINSVLVMVCLTFKGWYKYISFWFVGLYPGMSFSMGGPWFIREGVWVEGEWSQQWVCTNAVWLLFQYFIPSVSLPGQLSLNFWYSIFIIESWISSNHDKSIWICIVEKFTVLNK